MDWFPDETSCVSYLERIRWPAGFICPRCGQAGEAYRSSRGRLMCRYCRYQGSVTAGTVFEKTRTSLRNWLAAVWYITNQKQGVTALGLQRALGLGSYQTAWTMLHRLRRAMVRPGRERLSGVVEVDEAFIGRTVGTRSRDKERAKQFAEQINAQRSIVAIAAEITEPKGFGRIRLRRVPDASEASLLPFVKESIEPGSVVRTDGSWAYRSLPKSDYRREKTVMLGADDPAHVTMPGVHRVASLLKRWLLGTHQGSVKPHHLDYYLDEFTFRFNRRTSRSRGLLFYRLLEQAVATDPVTYSEIVARSKHYM
jgi:transposase-like protein